jgi:hypothetical protein
MVNVPHMQGRVDMDGSWLVVRIVEFDLI